MDQLTVYFWANVFELAVFTCIALLLLQKTDNAAFRERCERSRNESLRLQLEKADARIAELEENAKRAVELLTPETSP